MPSVSSPTGGQRQGDDNPPSLLQVIDKWLHNPIILFTFFVAFLATLAALVLIAGLVGAGIGAFLAVVAYPTVKKIHNHADATKIPPPASPKPPVTGEQDTA